MRLKELLEQKETLRDEIMLCIEDDLTGIKVAADDMIECATNIRGQGYSSFISSRQEFMGKIDKLRDELLEGTSR